MSQPDIRSPQEVPAAGTRMSRRRFDLRADDILHARGRALDLGGFTGDLAPWPDRDGFEEELAARLSSARCDAAMADALRIWRTHGVLHVPNLIEHDLLDELWRDHRLAWGQRLNVPVFHGRFGNDYGYLDELERHSDPGLRLFNFHHFSDAALRLLMHPVVLGYVRLLLDRTPVAMQTLTYERSSEQVVHADYVPVRPEIASHLVGCWIACEDIAPDAGPLVYYPGSHRSDHMAGDPDVVRDFIRSVPDIRAKWLAAVLRDGLRRREFLPRKGDVLFWHSRLLHGGGEMRRPELTRKSIVCHYSTTEAYSACNFYTNVRRREMNGGFYFDLTD